MMRVLPVGVSPDSLPSAPFALVVSEHGGLRIHAANAPARAGGVRPGQALADARAVLPSLKTRPAELERDHAALLTLVRWAGRYGPQRHVDGSDGFWIDTTGVAHLYGGEARLAGDLYRRLTRFGFTARIALAGTQGAAHALARFATSAGKPVHCVSADPESLARALAPLPVAALRLDHEAVLLARRLGLKRIGDLYRLPRTSLDRRFRAEAAAERLLARLDAALGRAPEPRAGLPEPPQRAVSRNFAEPLICANGLSAAVADLCHEMAAVLDAQGLGLRRGHLRLCRADGSAIEIAIGTAAPVSEAAHMLALLAHKLETIDAGFGIDVLRLQAAAVEPLEVRQTALGTTPQRHMDNSGMTGAASAQSSSSTLIAPAEQKIALARLADRLASRLGGDSVFTIAPAPRHLPEEAATASPLLALQRTRADKHRTPSPGATAAAADPAFAACHHQAPRPALLLATPEPITVMAEVPDGPPLRFTWRRVEHRVIAAQGPERIAPPWWQTLPAPPRADVSAAAPQSKSDVAAAALGIRVEPPSAPRPRDYYRIEDQSGGRYWVFRDGLYGRDEDGPPPNWFLHGLFA